MSGIKSSSYKGKINPAGVPNPTQKAINIAAHATAVPASQISDGQVKNSKSSAVLPKIPGLEPLDIWISRSGITS